MKFLPTLLLVFGLWSGSNGSIIDICAKNKNSAREPLFAALLDLHSGEHCDKLNIAAFQQLAVIEASIKHLTEKNKIKLGFQVFDTCSSQHGAVTAAMQAFVASQQTCLHSPLFIGFIGPENPKSLRAVKNFTNSFNFTHMIPFSVGPYVSDTDNALYVAKFPTASYSQAVEGVVRKLQLKSPVIVAEDGLTSRAISNLLRDSSDSRSESCSKRIVFILSKPEEFDEIINLCENHDGIIVIVETEELLKSVSRVLDSEAVVDPVIIVDLKNSAVEKDHTWSDNVLLINQISGSESKDDVSSMSTFISSAVHSFVTDSSRICRKHKLATCDNKLLTSIIEEEYDWTLQLQRMAILLVSSAVETAQKQKCPTKPCLSSDVISQNEWHDILGSSSLTMSSTKDSSVKISFGMDLAASYAMKTSFGPDGLKMIGYIDKGELKVEVEEFLPVRLKNVSCPETSDHAHQVTTVPSTQIDFDFFDSLLSPENTKLFEAVGLVCGFVAGILLLMLILTSCVYKNFKPESRPRSPSSHTTMSRAGTVSS